MTKVVVKGHEIEVKVTKSAYTRKAVLFANNIVEELKKIGVSRDEIEIDTNILGNKDVPATLEFWTQNQYMRFTYSQARRFIDNLYVIKEVIKREVEEILTGQKELQEFLHQFTGEYSSKKLKTELTEAKKILGVDEDEKNIDVINDAYKKLARKHHPDLGGDNETFQAINKSHKLIKKEMGS